MTGVVESGAGQGGGDGWGIGDAAQAVVGWEPGM